MGSLQTQGLWSFQDLNTYINVRELRSIQLACSAFLPHIVSVNSKGQCCDYVLYKQAGRGVLKSAVPRGNLPLGILYN